MPATTRLANLGGLAILNSMIFLETVEAQIALLREIRSLLDGSSKELVTSIKVMNALITYLAL